MKKNKQKKSLVMPVGIAVCILGIASFVFLHISSLQEDDEGRGHPPTAIPTDELDATRLETTLSPDGNTSSELGGTQQTAETPIPTQAYPEPPPPPLAPPDSSAYIAYLTGSDFLTIYMDEADIHSGNLLLVNSEYKYDIPTDLNLVAIANEKKAPYRVSSTSAKLLDTVMEPLDEMMQAFVDDSGRNIMYIISAFRDYASQRATLNNIINTEGRDAAYLRAKEPGFSEHHTGLAFDLATFVNGVRYPLDHFDVTKWFPRNSYKHGFILRYEKDKISITKTQEEPWHYRYVGLPHSYIMFQRNWALEEYVEKIKDYTLEEPLTTTFEGVDFEIFYSESTVITIPARTQYAISGNNIDGFIVTIWGRYDRMTNVSME